MGWGDCGKDSEGRPIGYVHEAICDEPGCDKEIDRGLDYACGDEHGDSEVGCERYFCGMHKSYWALAADGREVRICKTCHDSMLQSGAWKVHPLEGVLVRMIEP